MKKNLSKTPRSRIRSAIRMLWLRSRERAMAIKQTKNCCEHCGIKGSTAKDRIVKIEVHHKNGISDWEKIIDLIVDNVLEAEYTVLCRDCHDKIHDKE